MSATATPPQQNAIDNFAASKALAHATVGVCVMDLQTGKVVAGINTDKGLVAASTMKVVTAASALELLGEDFRYHTRVYAVGDFDDVSGRLTGNIVVAGGGDPTLGSRYIKGSTAFVDTLIMQLKAIGISNIYGNIIIDESAIPDQPVPGYWMLEDIPENYGTGYHAVNFADNQMKIHFEYDNCDNSYSTSTIPMMPWIDLRSNLRQHPNSDTTNKPGIVSNLYYDNQALVMNGTIGERKRGREDFDNWYANPAPGRLLADSIMRAMHTHDITLSITSHDDKQFSDTLLLLDYSSPKLRDILEPTLYRSINMFAEAVLRTLPIDSGMPATTANGVRMACSLWKSKGLDVNEISMKDGSGLARNGWTTPQFLCNLLRIAYSDFGNDFAALLPKAGKDGTVKSLLRNTPLRGKIALKSGSMGGVQCYAGYYPANEPRYAVTIMVNNFSASRSNVISQIQSLLVNLFAK